MLPIRTAVALLLAATGLPAADAATVIAQRCLACHAQSAMGGLRLDQAAGIRRVTKPGSPDDSLLIQAVRHTHVKVKMPPGRKLDAAEIAVLEDWVRAGAPFEAGKGALWSVAPLQPPTNASVDALIRKGLAAKGLRPNPPADRSTLLRRLAVDLTGLPLAPTDEPIEAIVDKLLASPNFGERWGRYWLDVARYGEMDFGGTAPRPYPMAWLYRDWVIAMTNRDMPYDLFLKAQIAGDLLPAERGYTPGDYQPGLGLFGLGPWYYGITMPPQARADERHDRVDMISRGMLGLTVACARCHDHKYDLISQKDYYALSGVFASTAYRDIPLAPAAEVQAFDEHKKKLDAAVKALNEFEEKESLAVAGRLAAESVRYLVNAERCRLGQPTEPGLDHSLLSRWEGYVAKTPVADPSAWQAKLLVALDAKQALDKENKRIIDAANASAPKVLRSIVLPFGYRSDEDFNPGAYVATKSLPYEPFQLWLRFVANKTSLLRFDGSELDRFLATDVLRKLAELRAAKELLESTKPKEYPYLMGIAEGEPWDLNLDIRGNPNEHGDVVPRAFPRLLGGGELRAGSGRLELARKVAAHPLAARVAVNRIWRNLFGMGLVRTPSNFGTVGDRPSHPELLEYLAGRFVRSG